MINKSSKPSILIAGYEIGGQMQLIAERLRAEGYNATAATFNSDFRDYSNDVSIPLQKIPIERMKFSLKAIRQFDVFHFFWGVSLLDFWKFYGLDLPVLRALKKKIIVHFRGSDLINLEHYLYPSYAPANERPPLSTALQKRKLSYWKKYANHILVSTPNLLPITGPVQVVPQVLNLKEWTPQAKSKVDGIVRIGHAPTRRGIKGTDTILQSVDQLKRSGLPVELVLIENIKYHQVRNYFNQVDIGIDQMVLGWYGKAAVEFMALGKPVVCYIDPQFMNFRKELPIVQADLNTLTSVLDRLVRDEALRNAIGQESRRYAEQYHDINKVVDELIEIYTSRGNEFFYG